MWRSEQSQVVPSPSTWFERGLSHCVLRAHRLPVALPSRPPISFSSTLDHRCALLYPAFTWILGFLSQVTQGISPSGSTSHREPSPQALSIVFLGPQLLLLHLRVQPHHWSQNVPRQVSIYPPRFRPIVSNLFPKWPIHLQTSYSS